MSLKIPDIFLIKEYNTATIKAVNILKKCI